jgi:DNA repair exonuclease SbcCD ATPase subunit
MKRGVMKLKFKNFVFTGLAGMFLAIMLSGISVFAQDRVQSILSDPRMVVIPERGQDQVSTDIDNAKATRQLAQDRKNQADARLKEIEKAIDTRKDELKDIEKRKEDAKKSKREAESIALQSELKAVKQAVDLLIRLKELRKAEIEEAKVCSDLSEVEIRLYELEKELQSKRVEYITNMTAGIGDLTRTTNQQVLKELEVRLLKLQKEQADLTQKLASKQQELIKQRMKLHEAQLKLGMPRA